MKGEWMTRTFAIRMDARKYDTVARLARRRGTTVSDVVREALDTWIERTLADGAKAPYVALADLVGAVQTRPRSGPSTNSEEGLRPDERKTRPRSGPSTNSEEGLRPDERKTRPRTGVTARARPSSRRRRPAASRKARSRR
jgi:hypothetical protein